MELSFEQTREFFWISTVLYTVAFFFALKCIVSKKTYLRGLFYTLIGLGVLSQTIAIYFRGMLVGTFPLTNVLETLQAMSWVAMMLIVLMQLNFRMRYLGFFGSALASGLGMLSLVFNQFDVHNVAGGFNDNFWIKYHVISAIFAYGLFGLLALTSLMYVMQDYALAQKKHGGFSSRLPSLSQLDSVNRKLLFTGVLILTVSVAMGTLIWITDKENLGVAKLMAAWMVWACYTILLILRSSKRFSIRLCTWWAIGFFIIAMVSLWPVRGLCG